MGKVDISATYPARGFRLREGHFAMFFAESNALPNAITLFDHNLSKIGVALQFKISCTPLPCFSSPPYLLLPLFFVSDTPLARLNDHGYDKHLS